MIVGIDGTNLRAGGGVTHLQNLLAHAHPQRHGIDRVILWCGAMTAASISPRPWLEIDAIQALDDSPRARLLFQWRQLHARAHETQCRVLFAPGGLLIGRSRIPTVTMCRTMLPFDATERARYGYGLSRLRLALLKRLQGRSIHRADGAIFLTSFAKERFDGGRFSPKRAAVIPHGVSREFRTPPRPGGESSWSADRPFRVFYTSTVDLYKHQWHIAEALRRLRSAGLPVSLSTAGTVTSAARRRFERSYREANADAPLWNHLGHLRSSELSAAMRASDAFVFASSCENLPNALLEAMASGLPIACSNRGPMPEVLRDGGLYFDPEDPDEIAARISQLAVDGDLRVKLAQRAFELSRSYDWAEAAEQTFRFIRAISQVSERTAAPWVEGQWTDAQHGGSEP
jgi:glycosyltransferase involved in cell wall biosynthesis